MFFFLNVSRSNQSDSKEHYWLELMSLGCYCSHPKLWVTDFHRLLIIFANSLDLDQAQQNVGPDQSPNCLTL